MTTQLQQAKEALEANHKWHQAHDEYDGYAEAELCTQNMAALAALVSSDAQPRTFADKTGTFADRSNSFVAPSVQGVSNEEMLRREIHNLKRHIEDYCQPAAPVQLSPGWVHDGDAAINPATGERAPYPSGLTPNAGKGLPPDTPRHVAVQPAPSAQLPNGWRQYVARAYVTWREHDHTTPDDVLDLMRDILYSAAPEVLAAPSVSADARDWVILQRPGLVPMRKGPFNDKQHVEDMLRDLYELYPDCTCTVINMPGECCPESGREWISIYGDKRRKALPPEAQAAKDAEQWRATFYLQRKGCLPEWTNETAGHKRLEDSLACVQYSKSTADRPLRVVEIKQRTVMDQAAIDAAIAAQPKESGSKDAKE